MNEHGDPTLVGPRQDPVPEWVNHRRVPRSQTSSESDRPVTSCNEWKSSGLAWRGLLAALA